MECRRFNYLLNEKLKIVENDFDPKNIFPFHEDFLVMKLIMKNSAISFLIQPKLFIRIRPGKELQYLIK